MNKRSTKANLKFACVLKNENYVEGKEEYPFSNSWDESIITKNVWEKIVKVVISFDTLERD